MVVRRQRVTDVVVVAVVMMVMVMEVGEVVVEEEWEWEGADWQVAVSRMVWTLLR